MPKKGLNIHKRCDGRWEGRYKSETSPNYTSVYGKTYAETRDKLYALISAKAVPEQKSVERTFSEILLIWMDNNKLRLKGATEHKYRTLIDRHIMPELGELKISEVNAVKINDFLARKLCSGRLENGQTLSPAYVRTMALLIGAVMRFATEAEYCPPLKTGIIKPVPEKKELQILSREEQNRLERYIFEHPDPTSLGALMSLYAGLRIGEVCALLWDDIDLGRGLIHIRHTVARVRNTDPTATSSTVLILDSPKTASSVRDIPIVSALLDPLSEKKRSGASGYFVSGDGRFVSPRTYEYRFHRLLAESGVKQVNYHVLRHTFATRCVEAGMDVKSLSELLGHASVGITLNTYVHSSMERKREQLELLHV